MENIKGLVSIIIPTYNRQKYICETIDSCLNQTYKNIEIIVIDDGSTDDTKNILKNKYNNIIKYYYRQNKGISSARNEGLKISSGEFIQFLDSDDLIKEKKIEKQVKILQENIEIFGVYCGTEYFKKDISNIVYTKFVKHNGEIYKYLACGNFITINSMLSRKIENFYFDENLETFEDWDYWIRIFYQKHRILYLNEFLCYVRLHDTNISRNRIRMLENEVIVLEKIKENGIYMDKINYVLFKENYKVGNQICWKYLKKTIKYNFFVFLKGLIFITYNKVKGKIFDPYNDEK